MAAPLFSFGLITDVQYADRDDRMNYCRTKHRYYRKSLKCLEGAIDHWNKYDETKFVVQLGDLLDGYCWRNGQRDQDYQVLCDVLRKYPKLIAHCWGNHEFYNFTRHELMSSMLYPTTSLNDSECASTNGMNFYTTKVMENEQLCCYHFTPYLGIRFVVIDCYDVSALGRDAEHPKTILARQTLDKNNPAADQNDHSCAVAPKFVKYNGGVGDEQFTWLEEILASSENLKEKVIICGHIPIHPGASLGEFCLVWNNEDMLNLVAKYSCVVAYFAGHDHEGATVLQDENGVHHCTFSSVLEAVPHSLGGNETAFATIDVYPDKMEVRGVGDIKSGTLVFR